MRNEVYLRHGAYSVSSDYLRHVSYRKYTTVPELRKNCIRRDRKYTQSAHRIERNDSFILKDKDTEQEHEFIVTRIRRSTSKGKTLVIYLE